MLQIFRTVISFNKFNKNFRAKCEFKVNFNFIKTDIIRLWSFINLKVYLVIIYCTMFVFITNYMSSKLYKFLFMSSKIVQLQKMRIIFRNKIISFKNLYYHFKSKLKKPIILIKSNKISVMQITILMIFGSCVVCKKTIKERKINSLKLYDKPLVRKNTGILLGHKKTLYSSTYNCSVTYLQYQYKSYVFKRYMTRFHGITTRLIPSKKLINISQRNIPDQGYIIVKPINKIIGKDSKTGYNIYESEVVTSKGQQLPLHENSHAIVRDKETSKDIGLLTSAKNPAKGNINIAPENYKGDILSNGTPKPQQFKPYQTPRYTNNLKNMKEDVEATLFVQKYDKQLNEAVKQTNNYKKPAIARLDKNSSQLFHENGQPIYDKDGNEIYYDN